MWIDHTTVFVIYKSNHKDGFCYLSSTKNSQEETLRNYHRRKNVLGNLKLFRHKKIS